MKTIEDLKNRGFIFACRREDGMEAWANFTGYLDCVHYVYVKNGKVIEGVLGVKTMSELILHGLIYQALLQEKEFFDIEIGQQWGK